MGTVLNLHARVTSTSQVPTKLGGTSASFQAYASSRVAQNLASDKCYELTVDTYVAHSWASGSEGSSCSEGASAFWYVDSAGRWQTIDTQDDPLCSDLRQRGVPAAPRAIDLQCYEPGSTASTHWSGASTQTSGTPVLGAPSSVTGRRGLGVTRPTTVDFAGDGTSFVSGITWSSWGGAQADGTGTAAWAPPTGPLANARMTPAHVRAFDLGTCDGRPAYRQFLWWFPSKGETFSSALKLWGGSGRMVCQP